MKLSRKRRLRKQQRMSKKRAWELHIHGQRPFVKHHPRRKVNKSTGFTSRAQRNAARLKRRKGRAP